MPPTKKLPTENVEYKATIKTNNSVKQYIGVTSGTIKKRMYNHKLSFTSRNYSTNTSLSTHIWYLKDRNISPTITWEILKICTRLQQDIKMPSLPPQETINYHLPIKKHAAKQKNQKLYPNADMGTNIYFRISTHTHNPPTLPILSPLLKISPTNNPITHTTHRK